MITRDKSVTRWSELRNIGKSPAHYYHIASNASVQTPAMSLGTLCHVLLLSPEDASSYTVQDWDGRTKAGKESAAEVAEKGLIVVSRKDLDTALAVRDAVRREVGALLDTAQLERELRWADDAGRYGGRADAVLPDGTILDLKTTTDASARACQRSLLTHEYHGQLAYYRWGLKCEAGITGPNPVLIWAETSAPYVVRVQCLSDAWMELGDRLVERYLTLLGECQALGEWTGYDDEVPGPPAYMQETQDDD